MPSKPKEEVKAAPINRSAVSAIVSTINKGIAAVNSTGSLLQSLCNIAKQQYKGKVIPKPDVEAMLAALAIAQKWKGRTADIRKSEFRSVLSSYTLLPEAMKAFHTRANRCSWHDGMALSRLLRGKAKGSPAKAAKMHHERGNANAKANDPATLARGDAKMQIAKAVKRVLKYAKVEREFRDALRELCLKHSIKV
jgi:hypothetical protein